MVGMSALAFLNGKDLEEEDEDERTMKEQADPPEANQLTNDGCTYSRVAVILDTWQTLVHQRPAEPLTRRPRSVDDTICAADGCNKPFEHHADPYSIECERCKKWYVYACVGINRRDEAVIATVTWNCPACRRDGRA